MENVAFYREWLPLNKKEFRILAMLADFGGEYHGNLTDMCRYFSVSPQHKNREALREAIQHLTDRHYIESSVNGRTYSLRIIPKEKEIVDQNMEMFEKSGFIIEEFGENTIKISGVPNIGYDIEYKSMFKDIVDDLLGATKTQKDEKEFRFIATLACKAAVKGRMKLDTKEQISLIDQMVKLDNPFTCPHGRPTAYEISKYEIERRFLRK